MYFCMFYVFYCATLSTRYGRAVIIVVISPGRAVIIIVINSNSNSSSHSNNSNSNSTSDRNWNTSSNSTHRLHYKIPVFSDPAPGKY